MRKRFTRRYYVDPSFPGVAFIKQGQTKSHQLKTISDGGMGFFASSRDARLLQLAEVDIGLVLDSKRYTIKGKVQYCKALPDVGPAVYYLGLSFQNPSPEFIAFIRALMDRGVAKGVLKLI